MKTPGQLGKALVLARRHETSDGTFRGGDIRPLTHERPDPLRATMNHDSRR
jgi:hypothetical protein